MTVAIGLVCSDGAIAASDSMSSGGPVLGVAAQVRKVYAMDSVPVVWTGSGHVYVMEEVEKSLRQLDNDLAEPGMQVARDNFHTPDLDSIKATLSSNVRHTMGECYKAALPNGLDTTDPRVGNRHPFMTGFIFLGYASGAPWLLEIADDGGVEWHTQQRFFATGSGGDAVSAAEVVLGHYLGDDLPTEAGLGLAFRLIRATCEVSTRFVRPPVQLAVVDAEGAKVLTTLGQEDPAIEAFVQQWLESERATLRGLGEAPEVETPPKFGDASSEAASTETDPSS